MDKQAFHVVLTTHNSRTSERMIKYKVNKGVALELDLEQEILLTKIIAGIIIKNEYKCIAYNICKDHVHLILVCTYDELSEIVKIIKGKSSYLYKRTNGNDRIAKLWSSKFFRADLDVWKLASFFNKHGYAYKDTYLENAINYIINNRVKHQLPKSAILSRMIDSFVVDQEEEFTRA